MTTMELHQSLLREVSNILADDELVRKTIKVIRQLKREHEAARKKNVEPYTTEAINDMINEALTQVKTGQSIPCADVFSEARQHIKS